MLYKLQFEPSIGLEVHIQLNTKNKLFTKIPYTYGEKENTLIDPVTLGLPGSLPCINLQAILLTIKAGIFFNTKISTLCKWDRKNYFYPDSSKGYQISQSSLPLCTEGYVKLPNNKIIKIKQIHLEEDVGKLIHKNKKSFIDYNRAGLPLIEIVSYPQIKSAIEAYEFLQYLKVNMSYLGISNCNMEKGELRCDVNISVRNINQKKMGTKVEIKNLNSFSFVKKCINYEINRQIELIKKGTKILQETRKWDEMKNITQSLRLKEDAIDYRYFQDPDIVPIKIHKEFIDQIKQNFEETILEKKHKFKKIYNLSNQLINNILISKKWSTFFEDSVKLAPENPNLIANFMVNFLFKYTSSIKTINPPQFTLIIKAINNNIISKQSGKEILINILDNKNKSISENDILEKINLISKNLIDQNKFNNLCLKIINNNLDIIKKIKLGKHQAINVLIGKIIQQQKQCMPNLDINIDLIKSIIFNNLKSCN